MAKVEFSVTTPIIESQVIVSAELPTHALVTAAPALPTHLNRVDGLRGTAALLIVVYHLFCVCKQPDFRPWHHINVFRPLHDGWCGVNLFLVLSGFCLFWPYACQPERALRFGDFMRRRAKRLIPPYYASLLLVPAGYLLLRRWMPDQGITVPHPKNAIDVILHLSLFQACSAMSIYSWHGITWSLSLEWMWYLAFPFAVWLYRRAGAQKALIAFGLITLLYRIGLYAALGPAGKFADSQFDFTFALRTFLSGSLFEFGLGMYVAWWLVNRPVSRRTTASALIAIPILLIAAHIATSIDMFLPVRDALYGVVFALLLLTVVSSHANIAQKLFAGKWICGVGYYSYSLYLFHMPFVSAICGFLAIHGLRGSKQYALSLLFLPIILGGGQLIFLAVEKPFLKQPAKKAFV